MQYVPGDAGRTIFGEQTVAREVGKNLHQAIWVGDLIGLVALRPMQQFFDLASLWMDQGKLPSPIEGVLERDLFCLGAWVQNHQNYPRNLAGVFCFAVRGIICLQPRPDNPPQEICPA